MSDKKEFVRLAVETKFRHDARLFNARVCTGALSDAATDYVHREITARGLRNKDCDAWLCVLQDAVSMKNKLPAWC